MEDLEKERTETERVRREKHVDGEQKGEPLAPLEQQHPTQEVQDKRGYKRKADDFFDELAARMAGEAPPRGSDSPADAMDAMQRIEAALAREHEAE